MAVVMFVALMSGRRCVLSIVCSRYVGQKPLPSMQLKHQICLLLNYTVSVLNKAFVLEFELFCNESAAMPD